MCVTQKAHCCEMSVLTEDLIYNHLNQSLTPGLFADVYDDSKFLQKAKDLELSRQCQLEAFTLLQRTYVITVVANKGWTEIDRPG